jgi:hypothetical protein
MAIQAETSTPVELDESSPVTATRHDNGVVVATATLFGLTYQYVFKPRLSAYTLGKFRVNGRTYNQLAAGDTDLPGERVAAERAFHAAQNAYDVTFHRDAIGHKAPRDLVGITPDEFTSPATDHTDEQLSLTLDNYRDDSNVTLTRGDHIYDHHTDTTYEVGAPHHRGSGACAREVEFRELPDGEFRTLNLSHVDTKLARGRWEAIPTNTDISSYEEYVTDDVHLAVDDIVTDLAGVVDGLTDNSTMRITSIRTLLGVGTRAVLTPETSFDYTNDLRIRAVPINDLRDATLTSEA